MCSARQSMSKKYSLVLNTGVSFSHIVGRMGKLEGLDVKLFCAAAMDFYRTQVRRFAHLFNCRIGKIFPRSILQRFPHAFAPKINGNTVHAQEITSTNLFRTSCS